MLNDASGFHVVDDTAIFRRTSVLDPVSGASATYGLQNNDRPLVTCNVVSLQTGETLIVSGFLRRWEATTEVGHAKPRR
jgi:hypothetical protein